MLVRTLIISSVLLTTACTRAQSDAPDAVPPAPAASPSPTPSPSALADTASTTETAQMLATVFARLGEEREHRATGTPSVEDILDALKDGGLVLQEGQQVLAAMTGAKYCWQSATTDGSIGFSVCEFGSVEALKKGEEVSRTKGASFGERTFLVNKASLITIKATGAGSEAAIEKAKTAFAALQ